jgi:hypothetical protein
MKTFGQAVLLLSALASQGCAEVRYREPVLVNEKVIARRHETLVTHDVIANVKQQGTRVEIVAGRSCAVHAYRDVARTVRRERYNANGSGTAKLGIAGGVITAAGGTLVAMPYTHARTDRAVYLGMGIPLAALGTTLMLAAISDAVKASGSQEEVDLAAVDEGTITPNAPCKSLPHAAAGETVVGRVNGREGDALPLGKTDERGRLDLDLAALPPAVLQRAAVPGTMVLTIAGAEIGTVSLREAARAAEEAAWMHADASACEAATAPGACASLSRYLEDFPSGLHAAEAREVVVRGEALIRARAQVAAEEEAHRLKVAERRKAEEARRAAAVEAAAAAARRAAAEQCRRTCRSSCGGAAECVAACVDRSCD